MEGARDVAVGELADEEAQGEGDGGHGAVAHGVVVVDPAFAREVEEELILEEGADSEVLCELGGREVGIEVFDEAVVDEAAGDEHCVAEQLGVAPGLVVDGDVWDLSAWCLPQGAWLGGVADIGETETGLEFVHEG